MTYQSIQENINTISNELLDYRMNFQRRRYLEDELENLTSSLNSFCNAHPDFPECITHEV